MPEDLASALLRRRVGAVVCDNPYAAVAEVALLQREDPGEPMVLLVIEPDAQPMVDEVLLAAEAAAPRAAWWQYTLSPARLTALHAGGASSFQTRSPEMTGVVPQPLEHPPERSPDRPQLRLVASIEAAEADEALAVEEDRPLERQALSPEELAMLLGDDDAAKEVRR